MAKKMKEKFGDQLNVGVYLNDSEEAKSYDLKASTSVFVNDELISLDIALNDEKMTSFLREKIETKS